MILSYLYEVMNICIYKLLFGKGQLILKADWRAVDSSKIQTDEFYLFTVKSKKANKTNPSVHFLGESFEIN